MNCEVERHIEAEPDLEHLVRARRKLHKDPKRAIQELNWLAHRGSVMSMIYLGEAYSRGMGVNPDLVEATSWYSRAADAGSVLAEHLLAHVHLKMGAVAKAVDALQRGVSRNHAPSMYLLGRMYFWVSGVERDTAEGVRLFERAMNLGNLPAKGALAKYLVTTHSGTSGLLRGIWLGLSVRIQLLYYLLIDGRRSERLRM